MNDDHTGGVPRDVLQQRYHHENAGPETDHHDMRADKQQQQQQQHQQPRQEDVPRTMPRPRCEPISWSSLMAYRRRQQQQQQKQKTQQHQEAGAEVAEDSEDATEPQYDRDPTYNAAETLVDVHIPFATLAKNKHRLGLALSSTLDGQVFVTGVQNAALQETIAVGYIFVAVRYHGASTTTKTSAATSLGPTTEDNTAPMRGYRDLYKQPLQDLPGIVQSVVAVHHTANEQHEEEASLILTFLTNRIYRLTLRGDEWMHLDLLKQRSSSSSSSVASFAQNANVQVVPPSQVPQNRTMLTRSGQTMEFQPFLLQTKTRHKASDRDSSGDLIITVNGKTLYRGGKENITSMAEFYQWITHIKRDQLRKLVKRNTPIALDKVYSLLPIELLVMKQNLTSILQGCTYPQEKQGRTRVRSTLQRQRAAVDATPATETDSVPATTQEGTLVSPTPRSKIWTKQEHEELVKGVVQYGMESTEAIKAFAHRIPNRSVPAIRTYIGRHKDKVLRDVQQPKRAAADATPATETEIVHATVGPTPRSKIWTEQEHNELVQGIVNYGMESTDDIKAFAHRIPHRTVPAIRTYIGRHKDKVLRDVQQPKRAAADATPATETEIVHATVGPTPRSKIWTEQEHNELVQGIVNYGMESTDDIKAFAHRIPHRTVPAIRTYIGRHKGKVLRDVQQHKSSDARDATRPTHLPTPTTTTTRAASSSRSSLANTPTPRSKIWTEQEHEELVNGIVKYGMESTENIKAFAHRIPHRTVPAIRTYIGRHKDKVLRDVKEQKNSDPREATRPTHHPTPTTTTTRAASSSRSSLAHTPTPRSKIWTEQEHEALVNGILKYGMENTEAITAFSHRIPNRTVPAIRTYIGRHKEKVLRDVKCVHATTPDGTTVDLTDHAQASKSRSCTSSCSTSSFPNTPTQRSKIWTEQEHEELVKGIVKYGMENTDAITAFSHRIPHRTVPAIKTYIGRHKGKVLRDVKYHKNSHNPTQTTTTTRAASSTGEERGGGPRSAPLSVAVVARENVLIESKEDEEADTSDDNVGDCPHPFDDENEDENDATSSTITQNTTFSKERAEVVAVNNSNNTYHNNKHGDDFPATTSHFPCTTMAAAAAVAAETETVEEITVARLATIGTTTTTATNAGTVAATAAAAAAAAIVSTRAVLGVTSEGLASLESTAAIDTGIATAMTNMDPNKKLEIRTGDVTAVAATADAATTIAILHEQQLRQQIIHAQVRRQQQQEQQFKQLMSTMQHDSHRSQQHLPPQHPLLSPTNATSTALAAYARGMRNEVSVMPTTKETPNDHTFNGEGQQDDNSGVTNVATAASLSARDFGHASAESDNHQNLDSISIEERKSQSCFSLSISERTKRKSSVNDDGGGFRLSISERTKRRNSVPEMFSPSISERAKRRHSALATTSSTAATSKILETGIRTSIVQTSDKVRCKFCGEVMKIKGLAVHHARWCKKIPSVTSILDDNSNDEVPQKRRRSRPRRFDDDEIDNDNDNKNKNTDTGINDDKVECEFCGKFFAAGMAMTSHLSRWCKKKPTGKKDTAVGTVECDFCGQFFANEMAMRVHRSRWCKKKPLGEQDKNKDERNKDDLIDTENNIEKSKRRSLELARLRQRKYRAKRTLAQTEAEERLIVADTIDEIPRKRRRTRPKRFDTGEDNTESRDSISASQLLKSKHRTCSVHFEEKNIRQTRTEQKRSNNHSVDGTLSSTIKNKNHFELSNTARRTRTLRATRANNDSNGIASINSMEDTIESQTQFNDEFVIVANETKVERGSVLMPMLEITKSPYDGILCAEVDEQYFDELLVLLDTPIINKIRFEMDRSSMLFNESWLTGRIHGKDFADIIDTQTYFPTRESMVLLCLWQSRLMKANDIVKSIVEKLNCFDLVLAAMEAWGFEDEYPKLVSNKNNVKDKRLFVYTGLKRHCYKCQIFVARAFATYQMLSMKKNTSCENNEQHGSESSLETVVANPRPSLVKKIKACLDIMHEHTRVVNTIEYDKLTKKRKSGPGPKNLISKKTKTIAGRTYTELDDLSYTSASENSSAEGSASSDDDDDNCATSSDDDEDTSSIDVVNMDPDSLWKSIQAQTKKKMELHLKSGKPYPKLPPGKGELPTGVCEKRGRHNMVSSYQVSVYHPINKRTRYIGCWKRPEHAAQAFLYVKELVDNVFGRIMSVSSSKQSPRNLRDVDGDEFSDSNSDSDSDSDSDSGSDNDSNSSNDSSDSDNTSSSSSDESDNDYDVDTTSGTVKTTDHHASSCQRDGSGIHRHTKNPNMERFIRLSRTFRTLSREEREKELLISYRIMQQELRRFVNQVEYFGKQLEDPQEQQMFRDEVRDRLLRQGRIPPPQSQQQRPDGQEQQMAPEQLQQQEGTENTKGLAASTGN